MIKKIFDTIILVIVFSFLGYFGWMHSPLCAPYYFNKGKQLYDNHQYDASIKLFERSLQASSENPAARYFLTLALSKGTPTYSHQESLYLMANSKTHDSAQSYAKTQIVILKKLLLQGLEDNYIYSAILDKDILRWNVESFPLKVYFNPNNSVPNYYRDNIKKAMGEWTRGTQFIQFAEVFEEKDSDIYVNFINYDGPKCTSSYCQYVVATTTNTTDNHNRLNKMIINFYKTNPFGGQFSQSEIYNAALHEVGHALGIAGHSDNPLDVMYANHHTITSAFAPYTNGYIALSKRDLNTVALLYRLAPSITNMKGWYSENLYYPPLILGNEEEILQKKLDEYMKYVREYPNFCGGYINIATVYSSMGNNKLANDALNRAESLATNDNERFLIRYNRAVLYYNSQDFVSALQAAKEAQQIKNDESVTSFINEINMILNESK